MDLTTISLFKDIIKGVVSNPKEGRKKGRIIVKTIIIAYWDSGNKRLIEFITKILNYSGEDCHDL
jgi:hypothetical protein